MHKRHCPSVVLRQAGNVGPKPGPQCGQKLSNKHGKNSRRRWKANLRARSRSFAAAPLLLETLTLTKDKAGLQVQLLLHVICMQE